MTVTEAAPGGGPAADAPPEAESGDGPDGGRPGPARPPLVRRIGPGVLSGAVYALCATLLYGGHWWASSTTMVGCACDDQVQEVWFLAWPPYALTHAHNLFFTTWLNYPHGVNLTTNTSYPLLGILGAPVTWLWGPVATYNVLLRLALVASALAMCLVLRRWVRWWPACFVGGLVYGFSPYMIGQGQGHLFLTFAALPPLIVLVVDEILVRRRWSARRAGIVLGLLVVGQFLISPEVLVMTACTVGIGVVVVAVTRFREVPAAVDRVARSTAWALGVSVVLLAYPAWVLLDGPEHVNGPPHVLADLARYRGDLLGAVAPTYLLRNAPASLVAVGDKLTAGSWSENGMYLGIPLLLALVGFTVAFRRNRPLVLAVTVAVASWILSLGARLTIDDHNTGVRLPFVVLAHLPFVQDIEPARFALLTSLYAAAAFAMGLGLLRDHLRRRRESAPAHRHQRAGRPPSRWWAALPSLVVAALVVVSGWPRFPFASVPTDVPALFTTDAVGAIPGGSVVLTYPYPADPVLQGMLDQAQAAMRYKIIGGYAFTPGRDGVSEFYDQLLVPTVVQQLFYVAYGGPAFAADSDSPTAVPTLGRSVPAIREFLARYRVSTVIYYPVGVDPQIVLRSMTAALGPPTRRGGATGWFDVPARLRATATRAGT